MENAINWSEPIITESAEETEAVGRNLANLLLENPDMPKVIAFQGDLGVGKTVFTKGFTSVIAPSARVKSPTFALVNEYKSKEQGVAVFHFDMYRIENEDDLYSIGFYEYLDGKNFALIEWSENLSQTEDLPQNVIFVKIKKCCSELPDRRSISVCGRGGKNIDKDKK